MNSGTVIYADHNATPRRRPRPWPPCWSAAPPPGQRLVNARHRPGGEATARRGPRRLAKVLDCKPAGLVFTSGATEANHMALHAAPRLTGRTACW